MVMVEVQWYDWTDLPMDLQRGQHVYVGDACCEKRLPSVDFAVETAHRLKKKEVQLTLVTPFVSETGLKQTTDLIKTLCGVYQPLEVVCNDWGVLDMAAEMPGCLPIAGRQLVGQDTDPRWYGMMEPGFQGSFQREVEHIDGVIARLCYAPPPLPLVQHIQRSSLDQPHLLQYLSQWGVNRLELNNLLQGLDFIVPHGWHVSLHVPDVLVTIARDCAKMPSVPHLTEQNPCANGCGIVPEEWKHRSFPVSLYTLANGVYYINPVISEDYRNRGIDRIVRRAWPQQNNR